MKKILTFVLFIILLVSLANAQGGIRSNYVGKQIGDPDVPCTPGFQRDFEQVCVRIGLNDACNSDSDCEEGLICDSILDTCQLYDSARMKEIDKLLDKKTKSSADKDKLIELLDDQIRELEGILNQGDLSEEEQRDLELTIDELKVELEDLEAEKQRKEEQKEQFYAMLGSIKGAIKGFFSLLPWYGWIAVLALIALILFVLPMWKCHECGSMKAPLRRCKWNKMVASQKEIA